MKKPTRGKKNLGEWKTPARKIPVNGKIPLDEKPGGNLVLCERNCLRLKNPCFMKE